MGAYYGDKSLALYYGDRHPLTRYYNGYRIAGWRWDEQSAPDMPFERTYNDRVDVVALGRSKQDGEPSPENPVPIISAAGELRVEGRNLVDLPTKTASNINYNGYNQWGSNILALLTPGEYTYSALIDNRNGTIAGGMGIWSRRKNDGSVSLLNPVSRYYVPVGQMGVAYYVINITQQNLDSWDAVWPGLALFASGEGRHTTASRAQLVRGPTPHPYTPYRPIITHELPVLRGIPDGAGGWAARDTLEVVNGRWRLTQEVVREILNGTRAVGNSVAVPPSDFASLTMTGVVARKNGQNIASSHFPTVTGSTATIITTATQDVIWGNLGAAQYGIVIALFRLAPYGATSDRATHPAAFRLWCADNPVTVDYQLAEPIITDLGPVDLPSYYPHTRVLIEGEYAPEVTARCRVVDAG